MKRRKIRKTKDSDRTIALSKKKQGAKKYSKTSNQQLRMPSQNKAQGAGGVDRKNKSEKVKEEKERIEYQIKKNSSQIEMMIKKLEGFNNYAHKNHEDVD